MRTIPGSNDPYYQSMTARDLIERLRELDPDTVIMAHDGQVIMHIKKDAKDNRIVYLSHNALVAKPLANLNGSSMDKPKGKRCRCNGTCSGHKPHTHGVSHYVRK